jgi:hypothetical protein
LSFSAAQIQEVWEKGKVVPEYDAHNYRQDECTAWMIRDQYGKRSSIFGWEIDHIDGTPDNNDISNLRPLQWENNASRQKDPLICPVVSDRDKNVRRRILTSF